MLCMHKRNINYPIVIIASIESARKHAADSSCQTTDDDRLGRGKRAHIPCSHYSSDEEQNDNPPPRKQRMKSMCIRHLRIYF